MDGCGADEGIDPRNNGTSSGDVFPYPGRNVKEIPKQSKLSIRSVRVVKVIALSLTYSNRTEWSKVRAWPI